MSVFDCERFHQENVRLVQRFYEAVLHKNLAAALRCLDDEVVWTLKAPGAIPFAGRHVGKSGVDQMLHARFACAQCLEFQATDFHAGTNHVTVSGHEQARARHTGNVWTTDWVHLHTLRSGRILRIREFSDTAAILAAFETD